MLKTTTIKIALIALIAFAISANSCSLIKKQTPPPSANNNGRQQVNVNANTNTSPAQVSNIDQQLAKQAQIKKFSDYKELKKFIEDNAEIEGRDPGKFNYGQFNAGFAFEVKDTLARPDEGVATEQAVDSEPETTTGSSDYSTTNIQVEGVDEADIIKTDGKYIYAVSNNNLFIIDAYPAADAKVLAKIAFKSTPSDIYIKDNSLIVFGYDNGMYEKEAYKILGQHRNSSYTFFKVFDTSDKNNPKQVRDLDIEGNYYDSRLIGDYVYFITNNYNYYLSDDVIIPRIIANGKMISPNNTPVYYFDMPYYNYNFTNIAAINIVDNNQKMNNEVYLLSSSQNMYVSQNNIYLTYTKYVDEQTLTMEVFKEMAFSRLSQSDQEKINKIETAENFILSRAEKIAKINFILERYSDSLLEEDQVKLEDELKNKMKQKYQNISKELEKTVIHKIAIDSGKLNYKTFGEVTGQALNQFSMDEKNGYFRIATTKNRSWSQFEDNSANESYSNLYVLDKDLKITGKVENLASGERIYSVRFVQDRAYMVTFKQTDPLFVIDLKDPTKPQVLGELKMPGFSNYLHPYDENILIGLGRETAENEWGGVTNKGIKLSLFDVKDITAPKEINTYIIGDQNTQSEALNDHKAFLFSREKNLLVIPVSKPARGVQIIPLEVDCEGDESGTTDCENPLMQIRNNEFRGAMVFKVDNTSFSLKGEISHSEDTDTKIPDRYNYNTIVRRSLFIDDVLYTYSNKYLKMNKIDNLSLVNNLSLEKKGEEDDDFEVIN